MQLQPQLKLNTELLLVFLLRVSYNFLRLINLHLLIFNQVLLSTTVSLIHNTNLHCETYDFNLFNISFFLAAKSPLNFSLNLMILGLLNCKLLFLIVKSIEISN